MKIADMNQRIIIQRHETKTDSIGNHTSEWVHYAAIWANVKVQSSAEATETGVTAMTQTLSVIVRKSSATSGLVSNRYRLIFNGRPYNISAVSPYYTSGDYVRLTASSERMCVKDEESQYF